MSLFRNERLEAALVALDDAQLDLHSLEIVVLGLIDRVNRIEKAHRAAQDAARTDDQGGPLTGRPITLPEPAAGIPAQKGA